MSDTENGESGGIEEGDGFFLSRQPIISRRASPDWVGTRLRFSGRA